MKTNEYHEQADKFLADNGLKMRITLSDSKTPAWATDGERHGHHYRVTISGNGRKLTFDFWGSVKAMVDNAPPHPYDVLACISADANTPASFNDFCDDFGANKDSIADLQTFRRCDRFAKRLRAFLTEAEQEQLAEVQ